MTTTRTVVGDVKPDLPPLFGVAPPDTFVYWSHKPYYTIQYRYVGAYTLTSVKVYIILWSRQISRVFMSVGVCVHYTRGRRVFLYTYINIIWHYHIIMYRHFDQPTGILTRYTKHSLVCVLTPIIQMWFFLFFFVIYICITRTHLTPTTLIVAVVFDVPIELSSGRCSVCVCNDNKRAAAAAAPWLYTFVAIISNILRTFVHNNNNVYGGSGGTDDDGRTVWCFIIFFMLYYILFDNIFSGS